MATRWPGWRYAIRLNKWREIESAPISLFDFTAPAAHAYAEIMGHRKETGRAMSLPDGQIAGIAHAHGFAVATRNIKDFGGCGIELINPFE